MKTCLIFIFSIFTCKVGFLQSYDSVANYHYKNGEPLINCTDSNGQKQEFWIDYKIFQLIKVQDNYLMQGYFTSIYKVAQGSYKNNKKSGIWEYYKGPECAINTYKTENYYDDGSVEEWKNEYSTVTYFSNDSNKVSSKVFFKRDTILINCENKSTCLATVGGKELIHFLYADLDYEQFRMYLGEYERQILRLKE